MTTTRANHPHVAPGGAGGAEAAGSAPHLNQALTHTRASDKAEHYIRSLIFSGRLAPGDRLPSERELAATLGISIITLRAALRSLEANRYLVVKLGAKGGWFVNNAETITRCWREWLDEHHTELNDLLELLELLEINAASLAAQRRTAEDLAVLEQAGNLLGKEWHSIALWHNTFHDALAKAAHNAHLERAINSLRAELFLPVEQAISEERLSEIRTLHERILAAIRAQDAAGAAEAMKLHLRHRRNELLGHAHGPGTSTTRPR
ncbi:MAG: FCD domain-containing protein [Thermoleophilia bacterium]|nr:FCD domain-containing protein [Thermoleophilia bacterium]